MTKAIHVSLSNNHARNIAVNCLVRFESQHQYIQDSLSNIFDHNKLSSEEKRLATELAYGTCRRLISLDTILRHFSTRPLKRIEPVILQILRVGIYQMLFLSGTPDFAVIHQAVRQAKEATYGKAGPFVNAVLRSVQRDRVSKVPAKIGIGLRNVIPVDDTTCVAFRSNLLPDPLKNIAKYYGHYYSQPQWLVDRWLNRFDEKTVQMICSACNGRPPLVLRVNTLIQEPEAFANLLREKEIHFLHFYNVFFLSTPSNPENIPGYWQGMFSLQDKTAMSAALLLAPLEGEDILDICAAPGGKTTQMAELMNNKGSIVACDLDSKRLQKVKANCKRLRIKNVNTCSLDQLNTLLEQGRRFDAILIDAPCSNTGVLARRVEARHLLSPADMKKRQKTQYAIMEKSVQCLKPTGRLLYSTCSIEPQENEALVELFLTAYPNFELTEKHLTLPTSDNQTNRLATHESSSMSIPWCDGGFIALLKPKDIFGSI